MAGCEVDHGSAEPASEWRGASSCVEPIVGDSAPPQCLGVAALPAANEVIVAGPNWIRRVHDVATIPNRLTLVLASYGTWCHEGGWLVAFDLDGSVAWTFDAPGSSGSWSSYTLATDDDGLWLVAGLDDGSHVWRLDLAGAVERDFVIDIADARLVRADGLDGLTVFGGPYDARVFAAFDGDGVEQWRADEDLGLPAPSYPMLVADGTVTLWSDARTVAWTVDPRGPTHDGFAPDTGATAAVLLADGTSVATGLRFGPLGEHGFALGLDAAGHAVFELDLPHVQISQRVVLGQERVAVIGTFQGCEPTPWLAIYDSMGQTLAQGDPATASIWASDATGSLIAASSEHGDVNVRFFGGGA